MDDNLIAIEWSSLEKEVGILADRLRKLDEEVQKKMLKEATVDAASIMLPIAKRLAPVETGALRDSLIIRKHYYKKYGIGTAGVFPDAHYVATLTDGTRRRPSFYLHLVEFGTKKAQPTRFMQRAFAASKHLALSMVITKLQDTLAKACPPTIQSE